MADYYSVWTTPPYGGVRYRLHLSTTVDSQDIQGNTSTVFWVATMEKDRSFNGFYGVSGASWSVAIDGVTVLSDSGQMPPVEWPGWDSYEVGRGYTDVVHDSSGLKTAAVAFYYLGVSSGPSVGTMYIDNVMDLTPIPRETQPTVSPNPAIVANTVTIDLPRASSSFTHDITWVSGTLSGTIGTGVATGATWTVPDVLAEFPDQELAPITISVVTKMGSTVIGTKQVTLAARPEPTVIYDTHPVNDPEKQFDVRVRIVTLVDGVWARRRTIPASTITMVDPLSGTATLTMNVSRLSGMDVPDDCIVDVDIFNGERWVYTNHRFVMSRQEGDEIDPAGNKKYSGTEFVDYMLENAYTHQDYEWGGDEGMPPTTPGEMMRHIFTDAKYRGWGAKMELSWYSSVTSFGDLWANTNVSRKISKGTTLAQVVSGLVEDGLMEYRAGYYNNKAHLIILNPGTGSSYTSTASVPNVNFNLATIARAPRRRDGTRLTTVTVLGDDNLMVNQRYTPYDPNVFGHLEGWVAASGVKDMGEANRIASAALSDASKATNERTFEYSASMVGSVFYPYHVFTPGDWVRIPDNTSSQQSRIQQITIAKTPDSMLLTLTTDNRIISGTSMLAKRQSAQIGGAKPGGTQNAQSPLDSRIPAQVVVNSITSSGYWTTNGSPRAKVTLSWAKVVSAMSGAAITCDLYEVYWRDPTTGDEWSFKSSTAQTTIEINDWEVLKPLRFRVRARSTAGVFGVFSEDQSHTTVAPAVDLAGPVISDLYTDGVGSIYISWNGLLGPDVAPLRLAYVGAEISDDGIVFTPAGTPIVAPGTIVVNPNAWGDFIVRLRPYDKLGNPGTPSDPETISLIDPGIAPMTPAIPTGLTSTAGAGWNDNGLTLNAWFDLEWDAVTEDTLGDPLTIVGYDVWGKRSDDPVVRFVTSSNTNNVRVEVGQYETWSFQVRAASEFGGISAFSEAIVDTADATVGVPDVPDAPTLEQYAGILRIEWSGNGMVPQVKYAYASISTTSGGAFTRVGMPLNGAGEVVVPGLAPDTYYAKINLVDELGQTVSSDESDPIVLLPITGVTIQTSELANTGIKMTNAALTAYDVSGNPTFILDATTGEVWIAPYDAVFDLGASGYTAQTGSATTGIAVSSQNSSFNTFIHPSGLQIRNDQTPLSWWEADATDASLVNFFSPRAVIEQRFRVGDYEMLREEKTTGSKLVIRYKGA